MPPIILFLILLLVGILLIFCASKMEGKGSVIFMLAGIILAILGGYGVFTALCK